ncbi:MULTISPECIES: hypothetical protein [Methylobacterium]|uniref:hypothetical protein n=1 Tax=Methylobacterium TaxID=407 RepID=UPI000AEC9910|nr:MULTISPECIES: hypothetical protein [Methylobacterium]MCI9882532.1 hypothetical protein [Methylobacterium goesingense]
MSLTQDVIELISAKADNLYNLFQEKISSTKVKRKKTRKKSGADRRMERARDNFE